MATNPQASVATADAPQKQQLAEQIRDLGDWFHNIDLFGVPTAPQHFLGDYPNIKWKHLQNAFPEDLQGASVLDIGCNAGFYSIALKRRNAGRVFGVDVDDRYLNQGKFAAGTLGLDISFQKSSVYNVDEIPGQFDWVLFLGVFYHLRYPLLALDKVATKIKPGGKLVFQTMLRGSRNGYEPEDDYDFWQEKIFADQDFPCAYFIEKKYSHDPTNWFIPNRSGAEAMLRSAGLEIVDHPEPETWVCEPRSVSRSGKNILELELEGLL
jgi:tRNA (mo5U34)-methyltransferase